MARIKVEINLPDWFDIKKYSATKKFDTACFWYEQLRVRKHCISLLTIKDLPEQTLSCLFNVLETIRKNPIIDVYNNPLFKSYLHDHYLDEIKTKMPHRSHGMHLLTVYDLYQAESQISNDKRIIARQYFDEIADHVGKGFYTPKYKSQPWFNLPLHSEINKSEQAHIKIDLRLPDKILKKQFENLLQRVRKDMSLDPVKAKSRRPISTSDLCKYAILPYLDLEMWAYQTGIKITSRVMADAIFPDGDRGEDEIKVSKKIAHQLMRETNLSALAAQAALEVSAKEK